MATPPQEPWFVVAGRWFYDGWNFAQFVSAFSFSAWASRVTGVPWTISLGPWLFVIAAFAWGIGAVRLIRFASGYVRVITDRPAAHVEILSSGTQKAILEIAHFGAPVTFSAEGRVVRVLQPNATPKPPEQRFSCELQPPEGQKSQQRLTLRDGEWLHIVIAEIVTIPSGVLAGPGDGTQALLVRRGSYSRRAQAPDSGVEVEFTIKTQPSYPIGVITRRIRVTQSGATVIAAFIGD